MSNWIEKQKQIRHGARRKASLRDIPITADVIAKAKEEYFAKGGTVTIIDYTLVESSDIPYKSSKAEDANLQYMIS